MTDKDDQAKPTQNDDQPINPQGDNTGDAQNTQTGMVNTRNPRNVSQFAGDEAENSAQGTDEKHEVREDHTPNAKLGTQNNPINGTGNETLDENPQPSTKGEQSMSGDMPDPAADDDTLEAEHQVGLRQHETEENREELDIASDRDEAEDYHKTH